VPIRGRVEGLEKSTEGQLVIWRFVVRRAGQSPGLVVELRGERVLGALYEGNDVELADAESSAGSVLTPGSIENRTLGAPVSVKGRSTAWRLSKGVFTTAVSATTASAVTAVVVGGGDGGGGDGGGLNHSGGGGNGLPGSGNLAPSPTPTPMPESDSVSTVALLGLAAVEFVVLWLLWYAVWGRRWPRRAQAWTTAGIAASAVVAFFIGLGVR
jgi:hypothetical protein